jgi:hypothetical protein
MPPQLWYIKYVPGYIVSSQKTTEAVVTIISFLHSSTFTELCLLKYDKTKKKKKNARLKIFAHFIETRFPFSLSFYLQFIPNISAQGIEISEIYSGYCLRLNLAEVQMITYFNCLLSEVDEKYFHSPCVS